MAFNYYKNVAPKLKNVKTNISITNHKTYSRTKRNLYKLNLRYTVVVTISLLRNLKKRIYFFLYFKLISASKLSGGIQETP